MNIYNVAKSVCSGLLSACLYCSGVVIEYTNRAHGHRSLWSLPQTTMYSFLQP